MSVGIFVHERVLAERESSLVSLPCVRSAFGDYSLVYCGRPFVSLLLSLKWRWTRIPEGSGASVQILFVVVSADQTLPWLTSMNSSVPPSQASVLTSLFPFRGL